jgi:ApeA N-terminal domain 1
MLTGEFSGLWWLPETPGNTAHGVLTLSFEARPRLVFGPSLDANPNQDEQLRSILGQGRALPLVFGRTSTGEDVTLADGILAVHEMEWGRPESATFEFTAAAAYVGSHLDPGVETFARLDLSVEQLVAWRAAEAFAISWSPRPATPPSIDIHGEVPPDLRAAVPGGELRVLSTVANQGDRWLAPGLALACSLRVDLGEAIRIPEWFTRYVGPLTRLLALASGRAVAADKVEVSRAGGGSAVEVVWQHELHARPEDRKLSPADLLFAAPDLSEDGPPSIGDWLVASASYEPVMDAFFATRAAPRMYEEDRFQNLVQSAEAYHRRRVGGRADQPGHKTRVDRLVAAAPEGDRPWLSKALGHSGEYRLDERILGLIKMHPWLVGDVIRKKPASWAAKAAAARNFRTHHDPAALPVAASTWDLIGLSQRMSVLVECCLLAELGFSEPAIEGMVKRASPAYRVLALNPL